MPNERVARSLDLADRCPNRGFFGGCKKDDCMHQLNGECVWAQYQIVVRTTTGTGGGTDLKAKSAIAVWLRLVNG